MPLQPPLTRDDIANLPGLLSAASDMMTAAWNAHACGIMGPAMLESVLGVQIDMGRFLAFFEDGKGHGMTDPGSIMVMRNIEMMATHLIENTENETTATRQ